MTTDLLFFGRRRDLLSVRIDDAEVWALRGPAPRSRRSRTPTALAGPEQLGRFHRITAPPEHGCPARA